MMQKNQNIYAVPSDSDGNAIDFSHLMEMDEAESSNVVISQLIQFICSDSQTFQQQIRTLNTPSKERVLDATADQTFSISNPVTSNLENTNSNSSPLQTDSYDKNLSEQIPSIDTLSHASSQLPCASNIFVGTASDILATQTLSIYHTATSNAENYKCCLHCHTNGYVY